MSRHDYMRKSGYGEEAYRVPDHAYKSDFVDGDGRRWSVAQTHGVRTIVRRKVESYVREVHGSRPTPTYSSSVTMGSGPFTNNDELLTKIFTQANGSPRKISDPNPGTNWGRPSFPHEPPDREGSSPVKGDPDPISVHASDPNRAKGRYSYPVREEIVYDYRHDPTYSSSPTKFVPPGDYGYDYNYVSSPSPRKPERAPSQQLGQSSSPVYDGLPQASNPPREYKVAESKCMRDYGVSSNNWVYDHPQDKHREQWEWDGSVMSPMGYGKPINQRDGPRNQIGSSPRSQQSIPSKIAQNQPQNSPLGLENRWGLAPPVKTHNNPSNYRTQWDEASSPGYRNNLPDPKDQWGTSLEETPSPSNLEERSSTPVYNHQNNPSSPKNPMKIESSKGYGLSSPKNQYGGPSPAVKANNNDISSNQWDNRPPTPVYDHLPNEEHYKPPHSHEVSYKGNTNSFPPSYSNALSGSRPNPNSQVNQNGYNLV